MCMYKETGGIVIKPKNTVLDAIAAQNGVTRAEVEQEIRAAIREARNHPDPLVQRRWKMLWPDGEPSPEEFIAKLAALTKKNDTAFPH